MVGRTGNEPKLIAGYCGGVMSVSLLVFDCHVVLFCMLYSSLDCSHCTDGCNKYGEREYQGCYSVPEMWYTSRI